LTFGQLVRAQVSVFLRSPPASLQSPEPIPFLAR
jgi:hypothetical protein